MASDFLVFFEAGACDLDRAAEALEEYGLTVTRQGDGLAAGRSDGPQFRIRLETGPHVAVEAGEIGEGTPHAGGMRKCAARFEVSVDDLDAALDEINTLMEAEAALQDASRGFLFLSWNGELSEPWPQKG